MSRKVSICIAIILFWGYFTKIDAWQTEVLLFTGPDLGDWHITDFSGHGAVLVEDSTLILSRGKPMTGVHRSDGFPKNNYEIELDAKRMQGSDFFCGMTFPVGETHCSLIVGGWGGQVVGLSSIDGYDASENETMRLRRFETGYWYHIRLRVSEKTIQVWIENRPMVDFTIGNHTLSLRDEVLPSRPFGISSWRTTAALKNISLRTISVLE